MKSLQENRNKQKNYFQKTSVYNIQENALGMRQEKNKYPKRRDAPRKKIQDMLGYFNYFCTTKVS